MSFGEGCQFDRTTWTPSEVLTVLGPSGRIRPIDVFDGSAIPNPSEPEDECKGKVVLDQDHPVQEILTGHYCLLASVVCCRVDCPTVGDQHGFRAAVDGAYVRVHAVEPGTALAGEVGPEV